MGGAFTDRLSWRWCFFINLPLGAVTAFFIILFFKSPATQVRSQLSFRQKLWQIDLPGTAVFIPAIVCLLLALKWGGAEYAWSSGRIIALFVVAGVLLIVFVGIQIWQGEKATVPPRLLKMRPIWSAAWFAFTIGASFFIMVYYVPIWFQAIKGVDAVKSGIDTLPLLMGVVICSMIGGVLVTTIGYYTPFTILSSVLTAVGAGLMSTWRVDTGHAKWIGYQAIFGCGLGFGLQLSVIAAQTVLDLKDVPTGTAVMFFSQTLGGALFVAVGENIFENKLIENLAAGVPDLDPRIVTNTGATSLQTVVAAKFLPTVLVAYNAAIVHAFYASVAAACLTILGSSLMGFASVKGKKISMAAA